MWEDCISESLGDLWVHIEGSGVRIHCCYQYTILPSFHSLSAYCSVLGVLEILPMPTYRHKRDITHNPVGTEVHRMQLFISCNALSTLSSLPLPSLRVSLTRAVLLCSSAKDCFCHCGSCLPTAYPPALRHRPGCLSSGASTSWISPFRHTRLPWQTLPSNLPSWPCHPHPWENLHMHPKQNTEARVRRLTGNRAPENTGQVPSCKEKRNDRL